MTKVTIIIPVINQAAELERSLSSLVADRGDSAVIVVDGGSQDGSVDVAEKRGWVKLITAAGDRGSLMNQGAEAAESEALLFLFPGNLLERGWRPVAEAAMASAGFSAALFRPVLRKTGLAYRVLDAAFNVMTSSLPCGSRTLLVSSTCFKDFGGFVGTKNSVIADFLQRLQQSNVSVKKLRHRCLCSTRPFDQNGLSYQVKRQFSSAPRSEDDRSAVFIHSALPGSALPFLQRVFDKQKALDMEESIARTVVDAVSKVSACRTVIMYDPADHAERLAPADNTSIDRISLVGTDRPAQLVYTMDKAFGFGLDKVVIVSTRTPQLNAKHIQRSLELLEQKDLVLGPGDSGETYLIAMKKPVPELFEDLALETENSFQTLRTRAVKLSLQVAVIEELDALENVQEVQRCFYSGLVK